MFRKILIVAMFATAAGYCFAAQNLPQVVTSEVFYDTTRTDDGSDYVEYDYSDYEYEAQPVAAPAPAPMPVQVPAWPLAGSDADVEVACEQGGCTKSAQSDNIRIVSKIGSDLVVENNFNLGAGRGADGYGGWSGGANMLHGTQIPVGFANECSGGAEMPLLSREMLEDDGTEILTVSRSSRPDCTLYADGYTAYLAKLGIKEGEGLTINGEVIAATDGGAGSFNGAGVGPGGMMSGASMTETEISVDVSADAEAPTKIADQVRSWVVANGQTLRSVLQNWADKEGWDLVWATSREYPIEASAVFRGRFVDVASALVRNFSRATPIPYAKFYKGNRVLVITTNEE